MWAEKKGNERSLKSQDKRQAEFPFNSTQAMENSRSR